MDETNEHVQLVEYVSKTLYWENIWTKLWSLLHHGFLFGASILSAAAALTLQLKSIKLDDPSRNDLAAGFAAISSLLGIISVSGNLAKKWRANRITKSVLERLEIDLMNPQCDLTQVRKELKEMKLVQNIAIVGEMSEANHPRKNTTPH